MSDLAYLSVNTKLSYVKDAGAQAAFLRELNPAVITACVDTPKDPKHLPEFKQKLIDFSNQHKQALVVCRVIHDKDGEFHYPAEDGRKYIASPTDLLNSFQELGQGNRSLYYLNEPHTNISREQRNALIDHATEMIEEANKRNVSLTMFNFGVGHPPLTDNQQEWHKDFYIFLKMLSENRKHYLGLHLYYPANPIERLIALFNTCTLLDIEPPQIVVTEYGQDAGYGGDPRNGFKTRNYSHTSYAQWQALQFPQYKLYIKNGYLLGLCGFVNGTDNAWLTFDTEHPDYYKTILANRDTFTVDITPMPITPPVPIVEVFQPLPVEVTKPRRYRLQAGHTLRTKPEGSAPVVSSLETGKVLLVFEGTKRQGKAGDMYHDWMFGQISGGIQGWIDITTAYWTEANSTSTGEFPPVKPDTPPPAENTAIDGLQPITVLSKSDIQKIVISKELELAFWRDMLAKAA